MGVTGFRTSSIKTGEKFRNFRGPTVALSPVASGGDEVLTVGGFKYHVFTTSGTFAVTRGGSVEVLVVGGGGGGGGSGGGSVFDGNTASELLMG